MHICLVFTILCAFTEAGEMSFRKSLFKEMESLIARIKYFSLQPEIYLDLILQIYELLEDGGKDEIVSEAAEDLKAWENCELNIAVTGESGAGKSSFINAVRGLGPRDVGAAPIGVTEMTQKPHAYWHPNFPEVVFWDLPGIGSPGFPPETYLEQVNFSSYDFFIVVSSKRFHSSDVHLTQEIQMMGKKFYFLRSKVDEDFRNIKRADPKNYCEEQVLKEIRDNCKQNLVRYLGACNPQIFLTSFWDLDKYDFPLLLETLEKDLPSLKRWNFLLSLPNISPGVIQKKKDALGKQLWKVSLVSAFIDAMPMGDYGLSWDDGLILKTMAGFYKTFGLDDDSLAQLAKQIKKPVGQLKAVIQSPSQGDIREKVFMKRCATIVAATLKKAFPVKGHLASGVISFVATYWTLSKFLDEVAEDAESVRMKVLGLDEARATCAENSLPKNKFLKINKQ